MNHLPVFLDIKDRPVLVAGDGGQAARRVERTLKAGARVLVAAPKPGPELEALLEEAGVRHEPRPVEPGDLEGAVLVFAATGDEAEDARIAKLAQEARVPVNVADNLRLSTFIMPSIVDRAPVVIAINSGGEAPTLARVLRAKLETAIPAALGRLARFAGRERGRVAKRLPDAARRLRFWDEVMDGPIAEQVLAGREDTARRLLEDRLAEAASDGAKPPPGEVYLVGAGPGDPDLLTFRALRLMQKADVVLHDRLVPDRVLDLVRRDAERLFVGKKSGEHALPQEDISRMMIRLAREGKRVLRLKSGDPFVFGRGGEEIEALAAEGIPFQVVPGVTAANGCASYAGIPLTHRDHAQSCIFVTGHAKDDTLNLNWEALVQPNQTVVVYMGRESLPLLTEKLVAHGLDAGTPAAIVESGTQESQRVVTGVLGDMPARMAAAGIEGPTIIIIGGVVALRGKLNWFATGEDGKAETTPPDGAARRKKPKKRTFAGAGE